MVVMAFPQARGSGGHSSTTSLAVSVSLRRFRAMVVSVPIFSVLLLRAGFGRSRRGDAAAFSTWWGCRFPWLRVVSDVLWACFRGLVFPAGRTSPPMLPGRSWAALRARFRGGSDGGFFALRPGVFPSGGQRRRPLGAVIFRWAAKTHLCKKSARGYLATGCRDCALAPVQ